MCKQLQRRAEEQNKKKLSCIRLVKQFVGPRDSVFKFYRDRVRGKETWLHRVATKSKRESNPIIYSIPFRNREQKKL